MEIIRVEYRKKIKKDRPILILMDHSSVFNRSTQDRYQTAIFFIHAKRFMSY